MTSRIGSLVFASFTSFAYAACSKSSDPAPARAFPTTCNGHAELCARRYDRVTFPGTHDADSTVADRFLAADQTFAIGKQLADGVRVLHLEMQTFADADGNDHVYLCHGACEFGKTLLVDALRVVVDFLAAHPNDVVTLLTESDGVTTDAIAAAFDESGLTASAHVQAIGAPWPTLGEMIQRGDRVVVLHADMSKTGGGAHDFLLPRFTWTWETPWDNEKPSDYARCNVDRGTAGSSLYVVDTYQEDRAIPSVAEASIVNTNPFLIGRLLSCRKKTGVTPSFVMVNFYEVGDLFHDVDVLNGFASAPTVDVDAFPPATFGDAGADASSGDGSTSDAPERDGDTGDARTDGG